MKLSLLALGAGAVAAAELSSHDSARWMEFKKKFSRMYKGEEEEARRLEIFLKNLERMSHLNKNDALGVYSHLSPFADWSSEEWQKYNRLRVTSETLQAHKEKAEATQTQLGDEEKADDPLPSSFDWREKGGVNEVKNQGMCGSCWSFSTIANIEGVNFIKTGQLVSLSEQQLVDCDPVDHGCEGGLPSNADNYLIEQHQGLETESDYPYTAQQAACAVEESKEKVFINQFLNIPSDEDAIARKVMQLGPLSIGINANTMQMYNGGVADPGDEACDPSALDHGVAIVGFGSESTAKGLGLKLQVEYAFRQRMLDLEHAQTHLHAQQFLAQDYQIPNAKDLHAKLEAKKLQLADDMAKEVALVQERAGALGDSTPFWIIRNSWGADWGENGYYRIVRGKGACGLNTMVTSAGEMGETQKVASEEELDIQFV